jgi:hypothetical protein
LLLPRADGTGRVAAFRGDDQHSRRSRH